MDPIKVALVDDHVLLRNGLAGLIRNFGYRVILECDNGNELKAKLNSDNLPQLVLMDINMPQMNGYETTLWLRDVYPEVRVLALSMYDDEDAIIKMIKNGARGYIVKDADPLELKRAIDDIIMAGVHYSDLVSGKLMHAMAQPGPWSESGKQPHRMNDREKEFLQLCCTELTYKEIAQKMHLSPRTIDGYREELFDRLQIKNRVGLALYAIKHNIYNIG